MNELLQKISLLVDYIDRNGSELNEATQLELARFLQEVMTFVQDYESLPPSIDSTIPQGADLLWILSGEKPEVFIDYLRTFPDQQLNALARSRPQLDNVIERLQQNVHIPVGGAEDGIAQAPIQSSNVYGFKYDPRSQKLLVRFQSGSVYSYEGVPAQIFKIFQNGAVPAKTNGRNKYGSWWTGKIPSLGAAFYQLIRQGGYPYNKLK